MQELSQQQLDALEQKWVEIRDVLEAEEAPDAADMKAKLDAYFTFFMDFAKQDEQQAEAMTEEVKTLADKLNTSYDELFAKEAPSEALLAGFRKLRYYTLWFFGKFATESVALRMQLVECIYQHDFQLNLVGLEIIIKRLKAEIVALKEEIAQLQAEIVALKEEITQLQAELEQAKATIATLEATVAEKQAKIDSLAHEVKQLQGQLTEHEATIDTHVSTINTLEQSVAEKDSALEAANTAKAASEEAHEATKAELAELRTRCEEQARALEDKQAVIDKLEAQLAEGSETKDN